MNAQQDTFDLLLLQQAISVKTVHQSPAWQELHNVRIQILTFVKEIAAAKDFAAKDFDAILEMEKTIINDDLEHYANSRAMVDSLKSALSDIVIIERHASMVGQPNLYAAVDAEFQRPKNRRNGLPYDEARQALDAHYARLNNMDKSRMDDDEKQIIDVRKSAMFVKKLYMARQAVALGIEPTQKRGRHL